MGQDELPKTLLVKHLPQQLSDADQEELLIKFGARKVKRCSKKGPLSYAAYADFESHEKATGVLKVLHQQEILGKRLAVEYAQKSDIFELDDDKSKDSSETNSYEDKTKDTHTPQSDSDLKRISDKLNSLSEKWNVTYAINPKLRYSYPAPSASILTNIANALASVPRFYVQVLHLMNRMNLPAPFGDVTPTPPLPETITPPLPPEPEIAEAEMAISSTEESELETDEDTANKQRSDKDMLIREQRQKKRLSRKRPRLKLTTQQAAPKPVASNVKLDDIFEQPSAKMAKKIEIKQVTGGAPEEQADDARKLENEMDIFGEEPQALVTQNVDNVQSKSTDDGGGFGKIEPVQKRETEEDDENEDEEIETEFISSRKLRRGRISDREMRSLSVFKRYERGEASSRLYIKNIAKQTTERDLRYIFGRYVNWENELEKTMFDIRLMKEGRMKGQAFVSLFTPEKAEVALRETHGFEFHGKPLVVQFARSSKLKDAKAETKPAKS